MDSESGFTSCANTLVVATSGKVTTKDRSLSLVESTLSRIPSNATLDPDRGRFTCTSYINIIAVL